MSWNSNVMASPASSTDSVRSVRASVKYEEIEAGRRLPPAPLPASIYFGGCAFGAAFYVGVYRALADMYGDDFYTRTLIAGDSGGSIFAVGVTLGFNTGPSLPTLASVDVAPLPNASFLSAHFFSLTLH